MPSQDGFRPAVKALLFYFTFLGFYGLYKVLPCFPLSIFCGVSESNFQHYKATFFCYLLVSLVEYAFHQKAVRSRQQFWYPRLMAAVFMPWLVFLLWYIAPAVYGQLPSTALEIVYANIVTLLVGFVSVTFEHGFVQIQYTLSLKAAVIALVVVSIGLYTIFTFKLPWADVFTEPDWRESSLRFLQLFVQARLLPAA